MWQVLLAALVMGSIGRSRPPVITFAALKKRQSYLPWFIAVSFALHLLLLMIGAFAVELVRDSNKQLRRDALVLVNYTPLRVSRIEKNYYPVRGAANPGHKPTFKRLGRLDTRPAGKIARPTADDSIVETAAGQLHIREFGDGSRQVRYPEDGRFDAVVQSSGDDLKVLSGPVQMVYLPVGPGRELILEYSVPARAQAQVVQSGMIVSVNPPAKVQPPWIETLTLPPSHAPSSKSSVFYGTLETNGKLTNMHALDGAQYESRPDLLASLEEWTFRPAEQDGAAVEIDVLLIVPADVAL